MNHRFEKIDNLKRELSEYRPLTLGEVDYLRDEFIINFTYNSNAIEGSTLTLDETALVIREGITIGGKSLREHLEAVGHRDACLYVEDMVRENAPLSEYLIKTLHSLVLMDRPDDKGRYRSLSVMITGSPAELPDAWEVPIKMERLMERYDGELTQLHTIEKVALFHLLFESIHPFIDGNGRTGRLIMNLDLMKDGYLPIDVKFTDRAKYVDAFKVWHLEKTADQMIDLVCQYQEQELKKRIALLQNEYTERHDITEEPTL